MSAYRKQYEGPPLQPLAKPIPSEDDYEGRIEYYKRKLSYKMPVTFRYGVTLGFGSGFLVGLYKKSIIVMPKHALIGAVVLGFGLCYHEFYELSRYYYLRDTKK